MADSPVALLLGVIIALGIGIALGVALGTFRARVRAAQSLAALRQEAAVAHAREEAARGRALELEQRSAEQNTLAQSLLPLQTSLAALQHTVDDAERRRAAHQESLHKELAHTVDITQASAREVRQEAQALRRALGNTNQRGTWGEAHLRRLVEAAGMLPHVDFHTQATQDSDRARSRPDLVVHLAGGRDVAVDAKAPMAALLESGDDVDYSPETLAAHAGALRKHISDLGKKGYWEGLTDSPELVVLFLPAESLLSLAIAADPAILEDAFAQRVIIATPTTLLALLRTVSHGWKQDALAENAKDIQNAAAELYGRLAILSGHLDKLGRSLGSAVTDYNKAVGSYESRVLVSARRFHDMGVAGDEVSGPRQVDQQPRAVSSVVDVTELPTGTD